MADDLLTSLVSGDPQNAERVRAIVQQLRSKQQLGELASMSGDPALAPFGQHVMQQNQQNEVELGRNAMANRSDDIRTGQLNRQLEQGQSALAETIRYHNMEDQERKDKLAQQKAQQTDLANSQNLIDSIGQYKMSPASLSRSPRNAALMDEVVRQYPEYDSTKFDEKKKAQVSFGSGPDSNLVKGADVSVQHLDTADQLATNLHNTQYPAVNWIANIWKSQTGSPQIKNFNTAKQIVSSEIEKFIIGGGSALADRAGLQSQLSAADNPEALKGVTNTLRTLMGGQLNGLQSKFVNAGLGTPEDFQKKLDPRTVGALGLAQAQHGGALPGAVGAAQGTPAMGSGPPQGAAPSPQGGAPNVGLSGAPGAAPGAISPAEAQLRQSTGALANGLPAPQTATVDNKGIVRTGRRNGKRIGQLADGTIVPLE